MRPELLILAGAKPMRMRIKLPAVIGRSDGAALKIRHGLISRRHCRLELREEVVWIEDLGSSNGTYVNGVRLQSPHPLRHGDNICVGNIVFRLELLEGEPAREVGTGPTQGDVVADAGPVRRRDDADLPSFLRYHESTEGSFVGIELEHPAAAVVADSVRIQTGEAALAEISRLIAFETPEPQPAVADPVDSGALAEFLKNLG